MKAELEALERELDGDAERVVDKEARPRPEDYAYTARRLRSKGVDV